MKMSGYWLFIVLLLASSLKATEVPAEVASKLKSLFPPNMPIVINEHDEQLWQVQAGVQVYFASSDGQYLFAGRVIDIKNKQNLTEQKNKQIRKALISELPASMYLSYPAAKSSRENSKKIITVFTDIDCPYCRKLHDNITPLNELGVTVNYVILPRAGVNSKSYHKAVSAICSVDPQQAMDQAMAGNTLSRRSCENTISQQLEFARSFGITSTPVTILPDGSQRIGYFDVESMAKILNL